MNTRHKQTIIFLAVYLFCLLFPTVILRLLPGNNTIPFSDLIQGRELWCYLALGVVGCFCNRKVRYLLFLFLMPEVILGIAENSLSWHVQQSSYIIVINTILFSVFLIFWQTYTRSTASVWQHLSVLYLGLLFQLLYPNLLYGSSWNNFISTFSYSIATYSTIAFGLLLTAVFCHVRQTWAKAVLLVLLLFYCFAGGFHIAPAIRNKCLFGTFTGRTEKKVSLTLRTPDGRTQELRNAFRGYNVCMVSSLLNLTPMKKFEGLAAMFRGRPVRFSVLGVESVRKMEEEFLPRYRAIHARLPLYIVKWKDLSESPLHNDFGYEYICIFRNDTLIYMGKADPTDRAARFITKELEP